MRRAGDLKKEHIEVERHHGSDNRTSIRYRFSTWTKFSWKNGQGVRLKGEGVTKDISVCGAYVLTSASICPAPGTPVQIEVFLAKLKQSRRRLKVATTGTVLRIEQLSKRTRGFAVLGQSFEILDDGIWLN
jgi:hypothetical protein